MGVGVDRSEKWKRGVGEEQPEDAVGGQRKKKGPGGQRCGCRERFGQRMEDVDEEE